MSGAIAIYMEGGGDSAAGKRALRRGMNVFLKPLREAAENKGCQWEIVVCGGRDNAYRSFKYALEAGRKEIIALLVDSEEEVTASPKYHLKKRDKSWRGIEAVPEENIHLMVQTMETWLASDADALAEYYGENFNRNLIPKANNLEVVPKNEISNALKTATRNTRKGAYHKIRHAEDLLRSIGPQEARARCKHCERLFDTLGSAIQALG